MPIALRFAARSDVGLLRSNNQDSGYAGPHLLVVADGMGGHAGGDVASSLAIGELASLDDESHRSDDALKHLATAVRRAHRELLARAHDDPDLTGMGTTVTALLRTGSRFALAHIGDSRAYLLRDGELAQITRDHTFVQDLVDSGRLTPEEAEQHPQRHVIMRVLSDLVDSSDPDLSMREARPGDRYLLCSDGLSGVVSDETLGRTLAAGRAPDETCEALIQLALRGGAPDNVTCIVADVVDAASQPSDVPAVVGSASQHTDRRPPAGANASPAEKAAALSGPRQMEVYGGGHAPKRRRRTLLGAGIGVLVLLIVLGGGYGAWRWSQRQYFVGQSAGAVAIYRGLPQDVGPVSLAKLSQTFPDVPVADLPRYWQGSVSDGIVARDQQDAFEIVSNLRDQAKACRAAADRAKTKPTTSLSRTPVVTPSTVSPATVTPATVTPPPTGTPTPSTVSPSSTGPTTSPTTSPSAGQDDCTGIGEVAP